MTTLNANRVRDIMMDCLFTDMELKDGPPKDHVQAEGITRRIGLHPGRLEAHRAEVKAMLQDLPPQFQENSGGGWSFLQACMDREGNQWTGLHTTMDELFVLGQGLGLVRCQLPREMWPALPGGMPYYVVLNDPAPAGEVKKP